LLSKGAILEAFLSKNTLRPLGIKIKAKDDIIEKLSQRSIRRRRQSAMNVIWKVNAKIAQLQFNTNHKSPLGTS
jgi:hypothetical protein